MESRITHRYCRSMKPTTITGLALSITAAALLAACGGSQPAIGAPGAMPKTAARGHSEAQKGDLLYVTSTTDTYAYVYMFSYPQGKLVGKIAKQIAGLC